MNIIMTRRVAQVFFLVRFGWFCVVTTLGDRFTQLRGWPVNWFLQLDPLVALGTALTTHTIYAGLIWALVTIALTMLLGRFFCGWLCPFGTLHQFFGWLGQRTKKHAQRVAANQYRRGQAIKYYILLGMLVAAAFGAKSLQTGWLDPIPLIHRSVNMMLLPLTGQARFYTGAWVIGGVFVAAICLNFVVPRFYCRFLCPLGALFGVLARWTPWRIGKREGTCTNCELCENNCEGACEPFEKIRWSECLLCMNCLDACRQTQMVYGPNRSAAGEVDSPDVTRRGLLIAAVSGLVAVPAIRLSGMLGTNWSPRVVRPPGALTEQEFLERCIKCDQCIRVCPTNVIQPAGLEAGVEGVWTPVLNFRVGTSGCQLNCVACGNVCPTAALRPLTLDEKVGRGRYESAGPVRMGMAFVDQGRCLPWAMDKPCIVCEENCPVTPKAIYLREEFRVIRNGSRAVKSVSGTTVELDGPAMRPGRLATSDYFLRVGEERRQIVENAENSVGVLTAFASAPLVGSGVEVEIRLQKPVVDVTRCTGCGICEHECPVSGLRAIRVSAENETRSKKHSLLAGV